MLKILIPTMMLIPTIWWADKKWVWSMILCQSLGIACVSLMWFKWETETGWATMSPHMATDPLSTPLLILSSWLLPLMILASQNHMNPEPPKRQKAYISLLVSLQLSLIMAFGATEIIMFYIMFETTLIPTLIIITRWGTQKERLHAGIYFLFYTMAGSLPLLVALMILQKDLGTLSMLMMSYTKPLITLTWSTQLWWAACLIAFLVKMPLYGMHLWLPKAHVEAPIAGSMVLAAVLLKLGGYGMIRILIIFSAPTKDLVYPFIIMALWGIIMTGTICLRQTDLKALIAYSSVSHMGLVTAGILTQTPWGLSGAMILMISHGLTSSALFCLANFNYERTRSRVLLLTRGLQIILPLMTAWWFIANLANMALPPLPNLMAEIMIITSMFNWSHWTLSTTGMGMLVTTGYSMYMFLATQRGPTPNHIINLTPTHTREHLLMAMHLIPILLLMLKPELIWGWHM
nr:NADH dehydrogenase subunit 4 [Neocyema erythrosoma]